MPNSFASLSRPSYLSAYCLSCLLVMATAQRGIAQAPSLSDVPQVSASQPRASGAADTSSLSQSPASSKTRVMIPGAFLPLRQQLSRFSRVLGATYTAEPAMPNGRLFFAVAEKESVDTVRNQTVKLLNHLRWENLWNLRWEYFWRSTTQQSSIQDPAKSVDMLGQRSIHTLARKAMTEEDRKALRIKIGLERLRYIAELAKSWPQGRNDLEDEDPDLVDMLNSGAYKPAVTLLASLPENTIEQALGGQVVKVPISSLSSGQIGDAAQVAQAGGVLFSQTLKAKIVLSSTVPPPLPMEQYFLFLVALRMGALPILMFAFIRQTRVTQQA